MGELVPDFSLNSSKKLLSQGSKSSALLAKKSLLLFKKIENNKGFISQLFKGTIQRKIKESATKEQHSFDNNTEILVGTNKYQNPNDKMQNELELYPFKKTKVRKTLIEPIIETRLSETIEKERLKNEKK